MKQVYRKDFEGYYIEPVIIGDNEELPIDCVEFRPPDGLYKPIYFNNDWVESMSPEEINLIKNQPLPKSEMDIVKEKQELMQQALDELIFSGGL